uniref:Uncharacterized protein n=1 Tax=Megaviridae environmental sample TaxID=1737588 RepID=A0A5J6VHG1_9VIRU|nr:MAG: hypothetical protein [Megaviridae environmental sample]
MISLSKIESIDYGMIALVILINIGYASALVNKIKVVDMSLAMGLFVGVYFFIKGYTTKKHKDVRETYMVTGALIIAGVGITSWFVYHKEEPINRITPERPSVDPITYISDTASSLLDKLTSSLTPSDADAADVDAADVVDVDVDAADVVDVDVDAADVVDVDVDAADVVDVDAPPLTSSTPSPDVKDIVEEINGGFRVKF